MGIQETNKLASALEGLPVWGCLPGSPSARAGVRAGDVILWANGLRIRTIDDYLRAKGEAAAGRMELTVFRDGGELSFAFVLDPGAADRSVAEVASDVEAAGLLPVTEPKDRGLQ